MDRCEQAEWRQTLRRVHQYLYPDWPDHYEPFDRLNLLCFAGQLPLLPIVRGLMPYGHCIGQTRIDIHPPRIEIGTYARLRDPQFFEDNLVHEMLHAWLLLNDKCVHHNSRAWCQEIERITPLLGLSPIHAEPI